jgi:hypothetical protein
MNSVTRIAVVAEIADLGYQLVCSIGGKLQQRESHALKSG